MAKSIKVSNINNRIDFDQFTKGKDCAKHMHVIMNVKHTVDNVMGAVRMCSRVVITRTTGTLTEMRTALFGIFERLLWRLNYGEYNFKASY